TLMVTDNLGGKTEANISIDVYAQPDKMEYEQYIGCRCKSKTYTYYNSDGNISKIISQTHKDGTDIQRYKYDEDGHLIEEYHLNYANKGKIFIELTTIYDEFGNPIKEFAKKGDYSLEDGFFLVSITNKLNYDEKNRLIQNISKENGLVDRIENNIYNNGEGIEKKTVEYYKNEVLSERYEYQTEYDTNGNKIKSTNIESDANGIIHINSIEEATYNSENKLLSKEYDDNRDGIIDSWYLCEYDSEGRVTKNQYTYDSKEVTTIFYEYDNNGNKISERREDSLDENMFRLYSYNEKGEIYLSKIDNDGDGNFEEIITNVYNDSGIKIEEKVEKDGIIKSERFYTDDGKLKERRINNNLLIKYIYDDNGKTMALIQTYFGKEIRTDYIYDDSGRLIQKVDENGKIL
ncbi:MAG: hypothetical protein KAU90_09045, partial [Sulfurovaceae bacterium]|nr:hypothetical protein [Sulfurovaceae bacterium]